MRWNGTSLFLITVHCRLCEREQYDRAGFVSLVLGKVGNAIDYITAASLTYPSKGDRELHHSIVTLLVAYLNKTEDKNSSLRGLMESHSPAPGIGASLLDGDGQQKLVSRGIPTPSLPPSLSLSLSVDLLYFSFSLRTQSLAFVLLSRRRSLFPSRSYANVICIVRMFVQRDVHHVKIFYVSFFLIYLFIYSLSFLFIFFACSCINSICVL